MSKDRIIEMKQKLMNYIDPDGQGASHGRSMDTSIIDFAVSKAKNDSNFAKKSVEEIFESFAEYKRGNPITSQLPEQVVEPGPEPEPEPDSSISNLSLNDNILTFDYESGDGKQIPSFDIKICKYRRLTWKNILQTGNFLVGEIGGQGDNTVAYSLKAPPGRFKFLIEYTIPREYLEDYDKKKTTIGVFLRSSELARKTFVPNLVEHSVSNVLADSVKSKSKKRRKTRKKRKRRSRNYKSKKKRSKKLKRSSRKNKTKRRH